MPKDSTRYVSSTMGSRRSRVQPIPDFRKIHSQWQNKLDQRIQLNAKTTVPEEFNLTRSGKKLSKVDENARQEKLSKVAQHPNSVPCKQLQANVNLLTETRSSAVETTRPPSNCDFECDEKALQSILMNTGVVSMAPPAAAVSTTLINDDQSATKKLFNFATGVSSPVPSSFRSQGCWVKDRWSIYDNWVPAANSAITQSTIKCAPAARVPLRNEDGPMSSLNQANVTNSNCIAGRTRSRFDSHFTAQTPIVRESTLATESKSKSCKRTVGLKETFPGMIPRSRSTSKPRAVRLVDKNVSMKTSTPRPQTRSSSKKSSEVVNVVRAIQFDELENTQQDSTETHQPQSSSRRTKRRSVTVEGYRRPKFDALYQDLNVEGRCTTTSSPLSPWRRDNIMSTSSSVRSPLSVVNHPHNRVLALTTSTSRSTDTLKSHQDISTKQAVAELMAMKKTVQKENQVLPPMLHYKSKFPQRAHIAFVDAKPPQRILLSAAAAAVDSYYTRNNTTHKTSIEVATHSAAEETGDDDDDGDKENMNVVVLKELSGQLVEESVNRLEKQARNIRRRSQLTSDVDERARLLRELDAIKQRLQELDRVAQQQSKGNLLKTVSPCREEDEVLAQPLNLKVTKASSAEPVSSLSRDVILDEPLNLKVSSLGDSDDEKHFSKDGRLILADITVRVVGEDHAAAADDECFEVPDSSEPPEEGHQSEPEATAFQEDDDDDDVPLDLCVSKRSTEQQSSVKGLPEYLASLELSAISETIDSPPKCVNKSVFSLCGETAASPDISSEFINYRTYCPLVFTDDDHEGLLSSRRCGDPVASMLREGDHQHFCPISSESDKLQGN